MAVSFTRVVVCSALVAGAVDAARVTEPRSASAASTGQWGACGIERWDIKTLQDRPRLLRTRPTTIAELIKQPRPASLANRTPYERHVFTVTASVVLKISEADQDLHLVLQGEGGSR